MPRPPAKAGSFKPKIIFIVGPTAVGKSELALKLAARIKAEIVSLDSMQVYKGLDILSSKLLPATRQGVPHHLLDVVSPSRGFNVSSYRRLALKKIKEIHKKGKVPLFVGGSGLYLSVLLDGIFKEVKKDNALRRRLYRQAQKEGSPYLYNRLKAVDEEAASKIHPNDLRRIIRALEVYQLCGRPISSLWARRKGLSGKYDCRVFGLNKARPRLYEDINKRVEMMFAQDLAEEVKGLLRRKLSLTALKAIGIKEVEGFLKGEYSLEQAKELLKKNTRNYAKRQLTWFRKEKRIVWIEADKDNPLKEILSLLKERIG